MIWQIVEHCLSSVINILLSVLIFPFFVMFYSLKIACLKPKHGIVGFISKYKLCLKEIFLGLVLH